MPDPTAKSEEKRITVRAQREQDLYALWKTSGGQRKVLDLFWSLRTSRSPLQAGDSVIQMILEREFGASEV